MQLEPLSFGGEFIASEREAEYRAERLSESIRHVRLVFRCAFAVNVLFYLNDWHFFGHPEFYVALPARTVIVVVSLLCAMVVGKIRDFHRLQLVCAAWIFPVAVACAALVTPHTESALFITFVLPNIFFLALPMSFRGSLLAGIGSSVVVLGAYMLPSPLSETSFGLVLGMLTINVVLILVLTRSNRLRRLEWAAARSERLANQELSEHREMLRNILLAVPTPLIITAKFDGRIIQANDAARRYFGDAVLRDWAAIENCIDRRDLARLAMILESEGRAAEFETQLRFPDGRVTDVLLAATVAEVGGTDIVLTVLVDISSRKEMEAHLERLATTDSLTGLPNRSYFFASAAAEIKRAQRYERPLAVVMVDIDFFKRINDAYGHKTGDLALMSFADLCRTVVRDQDVVARLGGEEFGILLPESDQQSALSLAERLRAAVEALRVDFFPTTMTISVGVSEVLPGESVVDGALSRADQALYAAKRSGRNRVVHCGGQEATMRMASGNDMLA